MIDDHEQALIGLKNDLVTGNVKSIEGVEDFLKGVIEADCLESANAEVLLSELGAFKERYLEVDKALDATKEAPQASITFYVAECMEYPTYGEYHETTSLKEAFEILDTIPPQRLASVTGIGFMLNDANSDVSGGQYPLVQGDKIQIDAINMVEEYKNSPLVQDAIKECEGILKEREAVMKSVVEKPRGEKSERQALQAKKSVLADLKDKQAIVDQAKAKTAPAPAKAKEAQLC